MTRTNRRRAFSFQSSAMIMLTTVCIAIVARDGRAAQSRAGASAAQDGGTAFTLFISRTIQKGSAVTLEFRGIAAGGMARLAPVGGSDARGFPPGAYLLTSDTSGAAYLVDTIGKTVRSIGAGARLGGIVELYTPPGTVSGVNVKLDTLGAGETVEGRATTRYRITARFDVALTGQGAGAVAQSNSVTDLWQVEERRKIPNPFLGLGGDGSAGDSLAALNRALVTLGKAVPGLTVRSVSHATLSSNGIPITEQRTTTRLGGMRDAAVDPAALRLPAGFSTAHE